MTLLTFLLACSDPPSVDVKVVDIWNKPVASATVAIEGDSNHYTVDGSGKVHIEVQAGTVRLLGGADGYIKDLQSVDVAEDMDAPATSTLTLFPIPEGPGFHGIGNKGYVALKSVPVKTVANELDTLIGINDQPNDVLPAAKPGQRFLFQSTLRPEELGRFDLAVSKLHFIETATVKGVLGETEIDVDLWVADGDIDFDVRGTQAADNYLLTTTTALEPGVYAFHAQEMLNDTDTKQVDHLPEELRVVYPFEVK